MHLFLSLVVSALCLLPDGWGDDQDKNGPWLCCLSQGSGKWRWCWWGWGCLYDGLRSYGITGAMRQQLFDLHHGISQIHPIPCFVIRLYFFKILNHRKKTALGPNYPLHLITIPLPLWQQFHSSFQLKKTTVLLKSKVVQLAPETKFILQSLSEKLIISAVLWSCSPQTCWCVSHISATIFQKKLLAVQSFMNCDRCCINYYLFYVATGHTDHVWLFVHIAS